MMALIESYVRHGRGRLRQWAPLLRKTGQYLGFGSAGLILSGVSLLDGPQPLAMALVCACSGWRAVAAAAGGGLGYWLLWGRAGVQGLFWLGAGLLAALIFCRMRQEIPALMPALAGLIVSASGLAFQIFLRDDTGIPLYLLRVALGAAGTGLFEQTLRRGEPVADWISEGTLVLALARLTPLPGINLGCVGAGLLAAWGSFPAAALGGLALDLAGITGAPMTAVMSLSCLVRLIPWGQSWLRYAAPGAVYLAVSILTGRPGLLPLAGLMLGGGAAALLPPAPESFLRQGVLGTAQVKLELMAGVLQQTKALLSVEEAPIDEQVLLEKARERACAGCPLRKSCRDREAEIPGNLLHRPLLESTDLPFACRKPGRMILELRRSQEQYRCLRAERQRRQEYRQALSQQYQFLSDYLQKTSDSLSRRQKPEKLCYQPEIGVFSAGKERANGDRCLWFAGTGCCYYVLLCDGCGTGPGAAIAGQTAGNMLRQMLCAGFPAEFSLRSVNSLLALRQQAGAVTVDLCEIRLDTGRVSLYKWGAAPSYLLTAAGTEKIGTAGPPPGLSLEKSRETVDRLSLKRGEVLILVSDGVDGEAALRRLSEAPEQLPGELAAKILEYGSAETQDDATVAAIRLNPAVLST